MSIINQRNTFVQLLLCFRNVPACTLTAEMFRLTTFWLNWNCCIISNTRKSVSSGYPNPEKWVEKTRRSRVFLTDFEVFGYLMKHSFKFLIWPLKPFIILGEIQSKSSQNFMLIKIRYPNHRHGSDFLCFLSMNY